MGLGAPVQPAAGVLVLSASRIRDFLACRRRFFLAHVVKVPSQDNDSDASFLGRAVHEELHARHERAEGHELTGRHELARVHELSGAHELADGDGVSNRHEVADGQQMSYRHSEPGLVSSVPNDPFIVQGVASHNSLCPSTNGSGAVYVGGEVDLRWLIRSKNVLLTGRADALWKYPDGTLEVRDYKTGRCPDSLDNDLPAAIYLLLGATHPSRPTRVRVTYERLAESPSIVTLDGTPALIAATIERVKEVADRVRKERSFDATDQPFQCESCSYAEVCPASKAR